MIYSKPTRMYWNGLKRKEINMYIARDKDGTLCVFFNKPVKIDDRGYWQPTKVSLDCIKIDSSLFPEVKWEDEEPTEVELVKKEE